MRTRIRFLVLAALGLMLALVAGCEPPLPPLKPSPLVIRPWDQLFGVAIRPHSDDCFIVGSDGLLLSSRDGGHHWTRRHLDEERPGGELHQDYDLYAIQFAPEGQQGWIVGEEGLILHSSDAGKSWRVQHSPAKTRLLALAVVNDQDVMAVGDHGTLLWSGDGGKTWTFNKLNNLTFYGVAFSDINNGWVVGEFQTVLHSSDGGKTWQVQRGGKVADFTVPPYFAVVPENDKDVMVAGQSGVYATSKDGGKTWTDGKLASERSIYSASNAPASAPAGSVWLAGAEGTIVEGVPGGELKLKDPTFEDLTDIVSSKGLGLAVGLGGTVLRTVDGGHWELLTESNSK